MYSVENTAESPVRVEVAGVPCTAKRGKLRKSLQLLGRKRESYWLGSSQYALRTVSAGLLIQWTIDPVAKMRSKDPLRSSRSQIPPNAIGLVGLAFDQLLNTRTNAIDVPLVHRRPAWQAKPGFKKTLGNRTTAAA